MYASFNARDVDAVLAATADDVDWPNMIDGGRLRGHDAVRAYWERQFEATDPHVDPTSITVEDDGRVIVAVHQVVRSTDGTVLDDRNVQHVYTFRDGLITRMEVLPAT